LQCSVATSALFPALPLPSIVKLNTDPRLTESIDVTQTETNKSGRDYDLPLGQESIRGRSAFLDMAQWQNYIRAT
jgi:hypothetical protein